MKRRSGIKYVWHQSDQADQIKLIRDNPDFIAVVVNPNRPPRLVRNDGTEVELDRPAGFGLDVSMARTIIDPSSN